MFIDFDDLDIIPQIVGWILPKEVEYYVQKKVRNVPINEEPLHFNLHEEYQRPLHRNKRTLKIQGALETPESHHSIMTNDLPNFPSPPTLPPLKKPSPPRQTYRDWKRQKSLMKRKSVQPQSRFINGSRENVNSPSTQTEPSLHQRQSNQNQNNNQIMSNSFNSTSSEIIQNSLTNVSFQSNQLSNEQREYPQPSTSTGIIRSNFQQNISQVNSNQIQIPSNVHYDFTLSQNHGFLQNENIQQIHTQPACEITRNMRERDPRLRSQVTESQVMEALAKYVQNESTTEDLETQVAETVQAKNVQKETTVEKPFQEAHEGSLEEPLAKRIKQEEPEYELDTTTVNEDVDNEVPNLSEFEIKQEPNWDSDASTEVDDDEHQTLDVIDIKQEPNYDSDASTINQDDEQDDNMNSSQNLQKDNLVNEQDNDNNVHNESQNIDYDSDVSLDLVPYNPKMILPHEIKQEMSSQ